METPTLLRWAVGGLFFAVFVWLASLNAYHCLLAPRAGRDKGYHSPVPFVGGVSGALALLLLPVAGASGLWWLPPLLDYGTVWVFVLSAGLWAWESLRRRGGE